jgi:hypothetical protein
VRKLKRRPTVKITIELAEGILPALQGMVISRANQQFLNCEDEGQTRLKKVGIERMCHEGVTRERAIEMLGSSDITLNKSGGMLVINGVTFPNMWFRVSVEE